MIINVVNKIHKKYATQLFKKDFSGREINIYELTNSMITGVSPHYPNTLLYQTDDNLLYNPINEITMSLKDVEVKKNFNFIPKKPNKIEENPVFFFIYNTDNYFHFIYDSLPYLISFNNIKKNDSKIKLLMNYPLGETKFYNFVLEFLTILCIKESDIIIADQNTNYKKIYVSTSYTHYFDSNLPPRKEIYSFYREIANKVKIDDINLPKKIYISRRSWLHGDTSNIGTNYTERRKMVNEDELVNFLTSKGYVEVFSELLTTEQKIAIFKNAESVIGAIGGGICNVLFSKPECKLTALVSPHFLDVNTRFKYSIDKVKLTLFVDSRNVETTLFKKYMRVKCGDIVGEITNIENDNITIIYSDVRLSGWNSQNEYKTMVVKADSCIRLDEGLNSSWEINLDKLINKIKI